MEGKKVGKYNKMSTQFDFQEYIQEYIQET